VLFSIGDTARTCLTLLDLVGENGADLEAGGQSGGQNQRSAVPKDNVENALHTAVCDGSLTLQEAQQIIVTGWFKY